MLTNSNHIKALTIRATDGEIGLDEFYFDDEIWAIRYLTIETGGWLGGRQVLISPFSITNVDWPAKRLDVVLTKAQVKNSPDINTYLWGAEYYPTGKAVPTTFSREAMSE